MHTVKLTQIGDSLGVTLPNSDILILSDEILAVFKPKIGDAVLIVKSADRYRISFNAMKSARSISIIKGNDVYYVSPDDKRRRFRQNKIHKMAKYPRTKAMFSLKTYSPKVLTKPEQADSLLPLGNTDSRNPIESNDPSMVEQLELGRDFMREFHETFQALAK